MAAVRPYVALAKQCLRANVTRLAFPMKLTFCITYWCNYRCETCNIWKMKPTDELSLESEGRTDNTYLYALSRGEMSARGYTAPAQLRVDASKAGAEARVINDG